VIAFDTGPGNMVVDALAFRHSKGALKCDRGGLIARKGRVNVPLLRLLSRAVLPATASEDCGTRNGSERVCETRPTGLPSDLIATATALTAAGVACRVGRFVRPRMKVDEVIVSGGGVHNAQMMAQLAAFLPESLVRSRELSIDPDAKEAIAFAVLAYETLHGRRRTYPRPLALGGPWCWASCARTRAIRGESSTRYSAAESQEKQNC
jgi:anhydro-N-acetylmuramic acid kinase